MLTFPHIFDHWHPESLDIARKQNWRGGRGGGEGYFPGIRIKTSGEGISLSAHAHSVNVQNNFFSSRGSMARRLFQNYVFHLL